MEQTKLYFLNVLLVWVTGEHGHWFCPEVCYGVLVRVGDVDLRQTDFQLFLQQKWVYSRSAKNFNLGS